MANKYDKGDLVRVSAAFNILGVATDPTTITLKVKNPAGTVSTYTFALGQVTRSGTGAYYKDVSVDSVGLWFYRWEGTGAVVSAGEGYFDAKPTEF